MNTLPTDPPRYIAFKRTHVYFRYDWCIVNNGRDPTMTTQSIEQILRVWDDNPPETVYDMDNGEFVPLVLGA